MSETIQERLEDADKWLEEVEQGQVCRDFTGEREAIRDAIARIDELEWELHYALWDHRSDQWFDRTYARDDHDGYYAHDCTSDAEYAIAWLVEHGYAEAHAERSGMHRWTVKGEAILSAADAADARKKVEGMS